MGVPTDPEQLFRIIANLIRKACQAIEAPTKTDAITLKAGETDKYCVADVKHIGPSLQE